MGHLHAILLVLSVLLTICVKSETDFSSSLKHRKYPVKYNHLESLVRSEEQNSFTRGIDGGVSCAACSVLLGMAEQLGILPN